MMTRVAVLLTTLAITLQPAPFERTTWRLVTMPGQSSATLASLKRPITIRFESGRVSGFSGCNAFNGPYTLDRNRLTFGDFAGTMMACGEPGVAGLEETFRRLLVGRVSFTIDVARLTVTTSTGALLTFEQQARATLEGVTWVITAYDNGRQALVSPLTDSELTITFANGTARGSSGCNTFRAAYSAGENDLTFGPVATTRRACAAVLMAQEREFLAAMAATARGTLDGDTLKLARATGELLVSAVRR